MLIHAYGSEIHCLPKDAKGHYSFWKTESLYHVLPLKICHSLMNFKQFEVLTTKHEID